MSPAKSAVLILLFVQANFILSGQAFGEYRTFVVPIPAVILAGAAAFDLLYRAASWWETRRPETRRVLIESAKDHISLVLVFAAILAAVSLDRVL